MIIKLQSTDPEKQNYKEGSWAGERGVEMWIILGRRSRIDIVDKRGAGGDYNMRGQIGVMEGKRMGKDN